MKVLRNPTSLEHLKVPADLAAQLKELAKSFDVTQVEPISCTEFADRAAAASWIELRHTGPRGGRGVVPWSSIARARFEEQRDKRSPVLQAVDLLLRHGDLTEAEKDQIHSADFNLSTFARIIGGKRAKELMGLAIRNGKLGTGLPISEAIKPLKRIALDIAAKHMKVGAVMLKEQQEAVVSALPSEAKPDLSLVTDEWRPFDDIVEVDEQPKPSTKKQPSVRKAPVRRFVVRDPKAFKIDKPRIREIFQEICDLQLDQHVNAVAVLMRVFLELSTEAYLERHGMPFEFGPVGRRKFKKLSEKISDAIKHMIDAGADQKQFSAIERALKNDQSVFSIDFLHDCVHNSYSFPVPGDLGPTWDNAEPFFARIWS